MRVAADFRHWAHRNVLQALLGGECAVFVVAAEKRLAPTQFHTPESPLVVVWFALPAGFVNDAAST